MENKKLIYILNNYSSNSSEHFYHVLNLLEEISTKGVNILLIIEKSDSTPHVISPLIQVLCLKKKGLSRLFEINRLIKRASKQGYNKLFVRISNWATIIAILRSFFSKLEVFYWHSGTVFEFDNKRPFSFQKCKWYLKTRLPFNFIKKYVTFFVTGPESMRDYYVKNVGVQNEKIKILYNDIDISRFKLVSKYDKLLIKKELNIDHDKKIILFVHKFSPVRNTNFYVENFIKKFYLIENLDDYSFYFIGGGKDKNEVEYQVNRLELKNKVFFLGSLPNSDVHKYYQIADYFINPTAAEGFPRVLLEAMACGLPIITTNAGGIKDIMGEKQKDYMSDINNSDEFADNLIKMVKLTNEQLAKIIDENLERVSLYSTPKIANMYIKTIFND